MANSALSLNNHTSTFPQHNLHILEYSRIALYDPLILPHRILKRCVLKGQDFIKLLIFTAPKTFWSDTGYFFFLPVPGYKDYN